MTKRHMKHQLLTLLVTTGLGFGALAATINPAQAEESQGKSARAPHKYLDRLEDVRDHRENVIDRKEDHRDHMEDLKDRREDKWDAAHDGGKADKMEDIRDRKEDVRDHKENVHDRKEDVRDHKENIRDHKTNPIKPLKR